MIDKIKKMDKKRLFKFCLIGGSGAGIHTGILYLLTDSADLHYMISAVIAGIFIGIYNYLGNHYWTFKDRNHGSHATGGSKFALLLTVYYGYYYGFLFILTSVLGLYYILSSVILIIIGFFLKYLLSGMWIWKHKDQDTISTE